MKRAYIFICLFLFNISFTFSQFPFPTDSDTSISNLIYKLSNPVLSADSGEESGNAKQIKLLESIWAPRLYPDPTFPARDRAIANYVGAYSASVANRSFCTYSADWRPVGPFESPLPGFGTYGVGTGQIHSIEFDPDFLNNNIMYAASGFGGLFKSTDAGATWTNFNTDQELPLSNVADIAIDPNDNEIIFIATGHKDDRHYPSIGVYRSINGDPWDAVNTGLWSNVDPNKTIQKILYHPTNSDIIFLATSDGVFRTNNASTTCIWSQVFFSASDHFISDIEFEPGNPSTVICAGSDIYKSTSGGNNGTWTSITGSGFGLDFSASPFAGHIIDYILIESTADNPSAIYALILEEDDTPLPSNPPVVKKYLYKFNGSSWSQITQVTGWASYNVISYMNMEVSDTDEDKVYLGETTTGRYDLNVNTTITSLYSYFGGSVHPDVHYLKLGPDGALYVGCDGGVYKGTNPTGTPTWTELNNGLAVGTITYIGVSQTEDEGLAIIGEQDCGVSFYDNRTSNTNSNKWQFKSGYGDGSDGIIFDNNLDMITSGAYGLDYADYSADGLLNINNGLGAPSGEWDKAFYAPIKADPTGGVIASYRNLHRKTNLYSSSSGDWEKLSNLDDFTFGGCALKLSAFAVAPSNHNYLYAVSQIYYGHCCGCDPNPSPTRLFRTKYGTITASCPGLSATHCWEEITSDATTGTFNISAVTVDPENPEKVWISYSGYDASKKVFLSEDAGDSWTNMSSGLPNLPVTSLFCEKGTNGNIYAGTDAGVYFRNNNSTVWECYDNGMPHVRVTDLEINYGANQLYAGTYGRGLWYSPLACPQDYDLNLTSTVSTNQYEEAQNNIISNQGLTAGVINYRAGNAIELLPNFEVTASVDNTFLAFIHPCDHPGNSFKVRSLIETRERGDLNIEDTNERFTIFPNPSHGFFVLSDSNERIEIKKVSVVGINGQVIVPVQEFSLSEIEIQLPLNSRGIHIVKVITDDAVHCYSLVVY